jgi:molybdopterin-biosynthesis enzyme MoeA-like protein
MHVMLDAVTPRLRKGRMMHANAIDVGHPEGTVADMLKAHQAEYPDVAMGSYPTILDNRPCTQLVLRSTDGDALAKATRELEDKLRENGWLD